MHFVPSGDPIFGGNMESHGGSRGARLGQKHRRQQFLREEARGSHDSCPYPTGSQSSRGSPVLEERRPHQLVQEQRDSRHCLLSSRLPGQRSDVPPVKQGSGPSGGSYRISGSREARKDTWAGMINLGTAQ